jgi:energy-coupling factor transporter ATP-binding protein EcfA2
MGSRHKLGEVALGQISCGYGGNAVIITEPLRLAPKATSILLGFNGSGKSTFLKTLCGLIPPVSGGIPPFGSGLLPEDVDFAGDIRPMNILRALCPSYPYAETVVEQLEIPQQRMYKQLSKGNRQKFRIALTEALAVVLQREVLCLDEPLSGLDLRIRGVIIKAWEGEGALGEAWSHYRGHRIISQHSGGTVSNATQTLVAWEGKLQVREAVQTCEDWPQALGYMSHRP